MVTRNFAVCFDAYSLSSNVWIGIVHFLYLENNVLLKNTQRGCQQQKICTKSSSCTFLFTKILLTKVLDILFLTLWVFIIYLANYWLNLNERECKWLWVWRPSAISITFQIITAAYPLGRTSQKFKPNPNEIFLLCFWNFDYFFLIRKGLGGFQNKSLDHFSPSF